MICCAVHAAVGCSFTLKRNTRRRSRPSTMNTYSTKKVAVVSIRKSIETKINGQLLSEGEILQSRTLTVSEYGGENRDESK
jgi:hypothetical protein